MKTKFTSQICTTREQSEKLIALGLKKETADMFYESYGNGERDVYPRYMLTDDDIKKGQGHYGRAIFIPAWSLDRLREIIPENIFTGIYNQWHRVMYNGILTYEEGEDSLVIFREVNIYDRCVSCIEWLIKKGHLNKEYLENEMEEKA